MSKIRAIPTTGIQDRPTREAIEALAEGWNLRNGITGSGDDRFVTSGDVLALIKKAEIAKSKPSMEDANAGGVRQSTGNQRQSGATGDNIMVRHPSLGNITLQKWLDDHVTYTIGESNFVRNELAAIKARLSAGGL